MPNKYPGYVFALVLTIGLSGCGVLMPYKTTFQCPETDKGKCVTMKTAYEESLKGADERKKEKECKGNGKECGNKKGGNGSEPGEEKGGPENLYRENLYHELAGLIKDPVTPMVVPPRVMRALILPYPDGERLYMPRYVFIMVDKPTWVLDEKLIGINPGQN